MLYAVQPQLSPSICASVLTLVVLVRASGGEETIKDLYLMGLISLSGDVWPAGEAMMAVINMALEQVNNRTDVLDGYRLNVLVEDTKVSDGYRLNVLVEDTKVSDGLQAQHAGGGY